MKYIAIVVGWIVYAICLPVTIVYFIFHIGKKFAIVHSDDIIEWIIRKGKQ